MKALVIRSRSSEESSKSSSDEKKRSPRSEGPGASLSVWFSRELESPLLLEGSFGAITPPEEKNLARITGTAFAIDSSIRFSNAGDATLRSEPTYSCRPKGQKVVNDTCLYFK